jgi:uncharacterized membrane protein
MRFRIKEKYLRDLFYIGIWIKGLDGLAETAAGIVLLTLGPNFINSVVSYYVQDELSEEPHSLIANFFLKHGHISNEAAVFAAILLIARGIIKLFVVTAIFRKKLWAYSTAIIVFGLFVIYQMYYYFQSRSLFLLSLSTLDIFVIALTIHEYSVLLRIARESAAGENNT